MKALSVRQPWASLIAEGTKTIELRRWRTAYRGPLLICAANRPYNGLPTGVALAVVMLSDIRPATLMDTKAACCPPELNEQAWILADVRTVKPFPVKGRLSLFEVELPQTGNL